MNTLPDKGVIIGRVPTDQKVVGSTPAERTITRFSELDDGAVLVAK
jgi:hypothetical protein